MTPVNASKPYLSNPAEDREASAGEGFLSLRGGGAERAVLVAVAFNDSRRRLTATANQARKAAALRTEAESRVAGTEEGQSSPRERSDLESAELDFDASLAEFQELTRSAGAEIAATVIQRRARPDAATLVGQGKLEEIAAVAASVDADLILFDHDLTPSQLRNLEAQLGRRVIDRTQLILDIFARHARTREGQLQVELAQLEYQLPRLAGRGKSMSQLGGGIGTRGPGETQLETDRRKIGLRIHHACGGACGVYQRGKEHVVQCSDRGRRSGILEDVRYPGSEAETASTSIPSQDPDLRYSWLYTQPSPHTGDKLSGHLRRSGTS